MKLDRFSSLHPSDQAEMFTGLVLYVHRHQTLQKSYFLSAAEKRLGRGNCPEK